MVEFRVQADEGEAKSHQNKHKGFWKAFQQEQK